MTNLPKLVSSDGKKIDVFSEQGVRELARLWSLASCQHRLMYEPTWLGIPIIQLAEDMVMMQELVWRLRPEAVVETGFAHGGTAVFYASLLELIGNGKVVSVDIEVRQYNKVAVRSHAMSHRIDIIEGSSVTAATFNKVKESLRGLERVLVTLDSNHSTDHVYKELCLYKDLVPVGGYMVAMDGIQKELADIPMGKPEWGYSNPLDAIHQFLRENPNWQIDPHYNRLHVTTNPDGFLRRVA